MSPKTVHQQVGLERQSDELMERVEARRLEAILTLAPGEQARLGQFFTPDSAAVLIASLPRLPANGILRVLDPGAGPGSLSAAIAARILTESPGLELEIVAVELDPVVVDFLKETLADIEQVFELAGRVARTEVLVGDYIEIAALAPNECLDAAFDLVIMNPPYGKISSSSMYRQALEQLGADCPNVYAAFLALGCLSLGPDGQMVAITPRSFANGKYFTQFRRFFLDRVALDRVHVFASRSTVFSDTGVLQENIILSTTRDGDREKVILSISRGHIDAPSERVVDYRDVVQPEDPDLFVRIPSEVNDASVTQIMFRLPASLDDIGVQVSTGRVVDFRSRDCLTEDRRQDGYPLVYPGNLSDGLVVWPRPIRKAQGFVARSATDERLLLPSGYYVAIKRFSSKEERRRVVAAVWDPTAQPGPVAFENHLNIIHDKAKGLDRDLAVGLSYWLNSSFVDTFFRTFSGHTQVNATDLRSLRFPSAECLRGLGLGLPLKLPTQSQTDAITQAVLECG